LDGGANFGCPKTLVARQPQDWRMPSVSRRRIALYEAAIIH
jgi:hypothetical protein